MTRDLEGYRPTEAGRAIQAFVDDLSNWYVRRSRRRFWKSEDDADKRAAYDTLYRCLVTLCHLLAPFTPFLAEEMYQNLVQSVDGSAPDSVHLASWPEADPSQVDERLAEDMRLLMRVASLGRAARSKAGVKIRQPLSTLYVNLRSRTESEALSRLQALLLDELNVKDITAIESEEEFLSYQVKPDLSVLGPRYGGQVGAIQEALRRADPASVARAVASGAPVRIDGWELTAEDVLVSSVDREGYASAEEAGYTVVVATSADARAGRRGPGAGGGAPPPDDAPQRRLRDRRPHCHLLPGWGSPATGHAALRRLRAPGDAVPGAGGGRAAARRPRRDPHPGRPGGHSGRPAAGLAFPAR